MSDKATSASAKAVDKKRPYADAIHIANHEAAIVKKNDIPLLSK